MEAADGAVVAVEGDVVEDVVSGDVGEADDGAESVVEGAAVERDDVGAGVGGGDLVKGDAVGSDVGEAEDVVGIVEGPAAEGDAVGAGVCGASVRADAEGSDVGDAEDNDEADGDFVGAVVGAEPVGNAPPETVALVGAIVKIEVGIGVAIAAFGRGSAAVSGAARAVSSEIMHGAVRASSQ